MPWRLASPVRAEASMPWRLQQRIDEIADEADLEEVYNTERHLL
jgi:hypothetical protein